jgi:hypothetical protein
MPDILGEAEKPPLWFSALPSEYKQASETFDRQRQQEQELSKAVPGMTRAAVDEAARVKRDANIAVKNNNVPLAAELLGALSPQAYESIRASGKTPYEIDDLRQVSAEDDINRLREIAVARDENGELANPLMSKFLNNHGVVVSFKPNDLYQIWGATQALTDDGSLVSRWYRALGDGTKGIVRSLLETAAASTELAEVLLGTNLTAQKALGKNMYAQKYSSLWWRSVADDPSLYSNAMERSNSTAENISVDVVGVLPQFATSIIGGGVSKVAGLSIKSAGWVAGVIGGVQMFGQAAENLREVPIEKKIAPLVGYTAVATALEASQLGKILPFGRRNLKIFESFGLDIYKMLGSTAARAAAGTAEAVATGAVTEASQGFLEKFTIAATEAWEASDKKKTSFSHELGKRFDIASAAYDSAYEGLIGGILGGFGVFKAVIDAKHHALNMETIGKLAGLHENTENKEALHDLVMPSLLSQAGLKGKTFSVDVLQFNEILGGDAEALAVQMGIQEEYAAAIRENRDMIIKVEQAIKLGEPFSKVQHLFNSTELDPKATGKLSMPIDQALKAAHEERSGLLSADEDTQIFKNKIAEIEAAMTAANIKVAGRPAKTNHAYEIASIIRANAKVIAEATGATIDEVIEKSPSFLVADTVSTVTEKEVVTDDFTDLNKIQSAEWGEQTIEREGVSFKAKDYVTSLVSRANALSAIADCLKGGA